MQRISVAITRIGLLLLAGFLLVGCGGKKIVTVKTLSSDAPMAGVFDGSMEKLKSDRPTEELRVSQELKGIPKVVVNQYLEEHPEVDMMTDYRFGPKDVVQVDFLEAQDLSGKMEVSSEGYIILPHVGRVYVLGLSSEQLAGKLKSLMQEKHILTNPEIFVTVSDIKSRKVKIIGAVGKAGQYYLKAGHRVLDVIAEAGGWGEYNIGKETTKGPDIPSEIYVIRRVDLSSKLAIEISLRDLIQGNNPQSNILLKDEDIIYIPTAKRYMIIGEVKTPGVFTIDSTRRTSILEAIIHAGGFTPLAAKNKVWIYRTFGDKLKEIRVRVGDIMKGGHKEIVYIEDNDLIIVPESLL
jgi:polysaccharide export outer membrane protein